MSKYKKEVIDNDGNPRINWIFDNFIIRYIKLSNCYFIEFLWTKDINIWWWNKNQKITPLEAMNFLK